MRTSYLITLLALATAPVLAGEHQHGHEHHEHGAHQHGVAKLEVAVDGGILTIHLESPLDNLVGFEHAPRTDQQRAAASRALATLKQGEKLFAPTPAAGCKLAQATVEAPVLEGKPADAGGHSDLDADYRFECAAPDQLKGLATSLFKAFGGMTRIDAAVVTGNKQSAFKLSKRLSFMNW